jgi:hypothetical protein
MPKLKRVIQVVLCKHETDPTLWRLCAGGTLRECTLCYEMQEVKHGA